MPPSESGYRSSSTRRKVNALKKFHLEFFDRANAGVEARSIGHATAEEFGAEVRALNLLLDQANRYAFLEPLRPIAGRIAGLAEKDYTYLLNHLADFEGELLTAKEDVISPIKAFMHGPQRFVYDEAIAFLREEEANFAELPPGEVQPLRDLAASTHPYRGNAVPAAKAAVTKLRGLLEQLLKSERDVALAALRVQEGRLQATGEYSALGEADRQRVLAPTVAARAVIESARFVTGVRDRLQRYNAQEYPAQLALASRLATPVTVAAPGASGGVGADGSANKSVHPPAPVRHATYTPAASLRPKFELPYIATQADLTAWLEALRAAAQAELDKGNRISL
jgi:hypothetical protein